MKTESYKKKVKENIIPAMLDYTSEDDDCGYLNYCQMIGLKKWREVLKIKKIKRNLRFAIENGRAHSQLSILPPSAAG